MQDLSYASLQMFHFLSLVGYTFIWRATLSSRWGITCKIVGENCPVLTWFVNKVVRFGIQLKIVVPWCEPKEENGE